MADNEITIYEPIDKEKVKTQILEIRGYRVMLDSDIATYFGVETKALNRAMKRNIKRFPEDFCFQLTREEYREILRCQSGTLELEQGKYSKYPPYVYTESGVAMLTSTLHTDRAIEASVQIIKALTDPDIYKTFAKNDSDPTPIYRDFMIITSTKADLTPIMANLHADGIPARVEGMVRFEVNQALSEVYRIYAAVAEAKALFDEVGSSYETSYSDDDAKAKTAEIQAMIKKLAVPENMSSASDENPVDCTQMIQNAGYDNATNDGWTLDANPGFSSGVIEVYNANFNEYQDVELPAAGTYTVDVQGFYRFGFADKEYETYTANPEENNNLKLYVKIGDDETIVDMPRLASDGSEEHTSSVVNDGNFVAGDDLPTGSEWQWTWMTEPVATADSTSATGVRIINGMIPVATAFAADKFGASLTFKLNEPGTVRIGLKKEVQEDGNWCIWDNWRLTYFGTNSSKEATAIEQVAGVAEAAKTEFFSLNGTRIQKPTKGVAIMKQTLSDGSVKVRKVIIK